MRLRLIVFAFIFVYLTSAAVEAADLLYPLQARPSISGNFGQYRFGHPHGGVDLWTFLQIGTPVLATDDGAIVQIKVSPTGYGRAIYQRLSDGRTAVYAHLSGFAPKIQSVVAQDQKANARYSVTLVVDGKNQIPVKRGEIIGYAGDTGTDVPHLHFEIRDRDGLAVNTLTAGLPLTDTLSPVLVALNFEPLDWKAHVNFRNEELSVPCQRQSSDVFSCPEVMIGGPVGLSVLAYDRSDGSPRRLAPYNISLSIDGRTRFQHLLSAFNYAEGRIVQLSYNESLISRRKEKFIRLYRRCERTLFHALADDGDLSKLSPGKHPARMTISDEHGNAVTGTFDLSVLPPCRIDKFGLVENAGGFFAQAKVSAAREVKFRIRPPAGKWIELPAVAREGDQYQAAIDSPASPSMELEVTAITETGQPIKALTRMERPGQAIKAGQVIKNAALAWHGNYALLEVDGGLLKGATPKVTTSITSTNGSLMTVENWITIDQERLVLSMALPASVSGVLRINFQWIDADGTPVIQELSYPFQVAKSGGRVVSEDGRARIDLSTGSLYAPFPLAVETETHHSPAWLEPVGRAYNFAAPWEPLKNKVKLSITPPPDSSPDRIGIYLFDKGTWWPINNGNTAMIDALGTYALMRDISPPTIGKLDLGKGLKPRLRVMVSDLGSGIKESGITVKLDGQPRIFEYMPLKYQFIVENDQPAGRGKHQLTVWVRDQAGNQTSKTFTFGSL